MSTMLAARLFRSTDINSIEELKRFLFRKGKLKCINVGLTCSWYQNEIYQIASNASLHRNLTLTATTLTRWPTAPLMEALIVKNGIITHDSLTNIFCGWMLKAI